MPLIPALWRQKQADLCEFEASLVYRMSSRTGSKATKKPYLKKEKKIISQIQACSHLLVNRESGLEKWPLGTRALAQLVACLRS